jgi:deazaflavin-dependent oxidoreductase (nitroreductase family)
MASDKLETFVSKNAKVNELQQLPESVKQALADHCEQYKRDPEGAHMWDPIVIGIPGGPVKNLLLTYTGRKSGRELECVLQYYERDGQVAVVGSRGGTEEHPVWYLNLLAHPRCEVQIARRRFSAVARTLDDAEHDRWWPTIVAEQPQQGIYQSRTTRRIPIVVLEPVAAG